MSGWILTCDAKLMNRFPNMETFISSEPSTLKKIFLKKFTKLRKTLETRLLSFRFRLCFLEKMSKYCECDRPQCDKRCSTLPFCQKRCNDLAAAQARYEDLKKTGIEHSGCGTGYCGVPGHHINTETVPDKLIFIAEWYDNGSDLIKKYMLIYYGVDGMCEIKDLINKQRFLRKLKLDNVNLNNLFLGNVINIYGRPMTLTEYGDSCTEQYLKSRSQRAFMLVKPHAVPCLGKILQEIEPRFKVLRARMAQFTRDTLAVFFEQYTSEEFYAKLQDSMTYGPSVAFLLVGENALTKLGCLAGNSDPSIAKLENPSSIRSQFGKDFILNAIHISESPACVERDASFFFTTCRKDLPNLLPSTPLIQCSTLCIIKPHAVREFLAGRIVEAISCAGFTITAFEKFYLDRTHAEEIYEIYKGVYSHYSEMTAELSTGPCYVLEISGCGASTPEQFRDFCGPNDPVIARKLYPQTLRAKYGTSPVLNAVHCTDLCQDAEPEVDYFFRILQML